LGLQQRDHQWELILEFQTEIKVLTSVITGTSTGFENKLKKYVDPLANTTLCALALIELT